ncbi:MAG: CBS domain-containing protein [Chloroflexota bacterium]|nr:CBS domain-containing protein [Chloroflexota bacterium]MDQ5865472.1 CBS domain-containing protein [Chloroflexota bacterium]
MLFAIKQLLDGRPAPVCVPQNARVKDALQLMMKHDFSQLPVVEADGDLLGIISHKTIAHTYFLLGGQVPLLDLTVDHCLMRIDPLTPEDDLFEACEKLRADDSAVVIVEGRKPVGLLTAGDLTDFFRYRSEDLIRIEDIEVTLRLRARDAFPDDASMDQALILALGPDLKDPTKPKKQFNHLSMADLLHLITHEQNWPRFNGMFEPLELFTSLMDRVRQVRNILAHFRGNADQIQDTTLKYAVDWLATRAGTFQGDGSGPRRLTVDRPQTAGGMPGKRYDPLKEWLSLQEQDPAGIRVNFRDIETLLGGALPAAAKKHQSWWSSNPNEAQAQAWLEAGWRVSEVNLARREVTFQPASAAATPAKDANAGVPAAPVRQNGATDTSS